MSDELQQRLDVLMYRLRTAYDGIGHSSGRPYVHFVYPPEQERTVQRMVDEQLRSDKTLFFHHIDLLPLTIKSLAGQEERRQQLLNDPLKQSSDLIRRAVQVRGQVVGQGHQVALVEQPQHEGAHLGLGVDWPLPAHTSSWTTRGSYGSMAAGM